METIPCPLCGSVKRRTFWYRPKYPLIVGRAAPIQEASNVSWLPLEISLCRNCYHIYQSRPPRPELVESLYAGNYVATSPSVALGGLPPRGLHIFLNMIRKCVGEKRGHAIEIGAYDGYFVHLLTQDGWSAVGYEPCAIAEVGIKTFGVNIQQEFYEPGKRLGPWDLVVSRYVFEHLQSPLAMLEGIYEEMNPGGWLALEVPDLETRLSNGILGCFGHEHISYFVPITLQRLVEKAGFVAQQQANGADGLVLLAKKPAHISPHREYPVLLYGNAEVENLIIKFNSRQAKQRARFSSELLRWSGPKNFIIYGGDSHTIDMLVEGWLPLENINFIIDDDPAKQGMGIAGFSIPIRSRTELPEPGQALIILSAFAHHDLLWENLTKWRSLGGAVMRFYPEVQLCG